MPRRAGPLSARTPRLLLRLPDDDCGDAADDDEHQAAGKEGKPGHGEHQDEKSEAKRSKLSLLREMKKASQESGAVSEECSGDHRFLACPFFRRTIQ